jgi:AraC-like DNA-binding protein
MASSLLDAAHRLLFERGMTSAVEKASLLAATSYRQRTHGPCNSWIYRYANARRLTKEWVGCGIEIGAQVAGEWSQTSAFAGKRVHVRGDIARVSMGEAYRNAHHGARQEGVQVGFVVFTEPTSNCGTDPLRGIDGELRFVKDAGLQDPLLFELCESIAAGASVADHEIAATVMAYVSRHCEVAPPTPLLRAKRQLERHFTCDLPLDMIAGEAGLHPETFARYFKRAYGATPASYRIMLRANYAARLLWSRPDLSVAEIASESGFPNRSYFHRTFHRAFGMTPIATRERYLRAA